MPFVLYSERMEHESAKQYAYVSCVANHPVACHETGEAIVRRKSPRSSPSAGLCARGIAGTLS
jgi:hypothetical protein